MTPAHNASATLRRTLESLISQTFDAWACVVVNDSSSDDTAEIAGAYAAADGRFRVIEGRFGSAASARNAAIEQARGEWLLFLDADDTIDPTMLAQMLAAADADAAVGAVHCGWRYQDGGGRVIGENRSTVTGDAFPLFGYRSPVFAIHACLVRRTAVEQAGSFDPKLKVCEDVDLWERIARCGTRFSALPLTLVTYNLSAATSWFDPAQLIADSLRVFALTHDPDPRCPLGTERHPDGAAKSGLAEAIYYHALYVGALAVSRGNEPGVVFDRVADAFTNLHLAPAAALDPDRCATYIASAVPLARVQAEVAWVDLWPQLHGPLVELLQRLERQTGAEGLAKGALRALERRVANLLPRAGRVGGTVRMSVAADAPIVDLQADGAHTALVSVHYAGSLLGELGFAVCDGSVRAAVLADAIASRFAWEIVGRLFARTVYRSLSFAAEPNNFVVLGAETRRGASPAPLPPDSPELHERVGWTVFLQQVFRRSSWSEGVFYEPNTFETLPLSDDVDLWFEISDNGGVHAELPGLARVGITVAGLPVGAMRLRTVEGQVTGDQLTAAAAQCLGRRLLRVVVREAVLGAPPGTVPLAERIAAARSTRQGAVLVHPPGAGFTWRTLAAAIGLDAETILVGRWPAQTGADVDLPRACLPAALASLLVADEPGRPLLVAQSDAALSSPRRIIFAPEICSAKLTTHDTAHHEAPAQSDDGNVRHHFETLFATGANPWTYDSAYEQTKYEQTLSLVPDRPPARALELACAEGHFTAQLAPRVVSLVAADISQTALDRAQLACAHLTNVVYRRLDLAHDPVGGPFDLITCCEVLYYLKDVEQLASVAQLITNALAPDGTLILAHANLVVDAPDQPGFDWAVPFGARTIGEAFARNRGLVFETELRTDLYRIQAFRRRSLRDVLTPRSARPRRVVAAPFAEPEPHVAARILWHGGQVSPAAAIRDRTERLPILMYHRIARPRDAASARWCVDPQEFEAQLQYLRDVGIRSASFSEWRAARRERKPLPGMRVLITFDDGYRDFAEEAWPLLQRYGFNATVFVPTGHVGGVARWGARFGTVAPLLGWDDIAALRAEGAAFGSHGVSHRPLTGLDNTEVARELLSSRQELESRLGTPVTTFCYPYGRLTPELAQLVGATGYLDSVTTRAGRSTLDDHDLTLHRVEVDGRAPLSAFIAAFHG